MSNRTPQNTNPFRAQRHDASRRQTKEDWEDWSDEEAVTPIMNEVGEEPLIDAAAETAARPATMRTQAQTHARMSAARQSIHKVKRLKSRHRQKAQNAKAGIKLETDMSKFRQQQQRQQHVAHQMRHSPADRQSRTGKFVDAAALLALEGEPSTPSIGSFAWLKRRPKDASKAKKAEKNLKAPKPISPLDLSPNERPIMIGFEMPADSDVVISPQTATIDSPVDFFPGPNRAAQGSSQPQLVSAWSPDTEDGRSLFRKSNAASSVYSLPRLVEVPPVPSLPSDLKKKKKEARRTTILVSDDEFDDAGTPVTLFEESPVSPRKTPKARGRARAPTDASSRSQGWWDQVTTPFAPSPVERFPAVSKSPAAEAVEWWKQVDEKKGSAAGEPSNHVGSPKSAASSSNDWWKDVDEKVGEDPAAVVTPPGRRENLGSLRQKKRSIQIIIDGPPTPSAASSSRSNPVGSQVETQTEKARILAEENLTPSEQPPPYEPPSKQEMVRYRAVFPPGHRLNTLYPPSPGPVPPGLTRTMTSQGGIDLSDVPLTPPPAVTHIYEAPLPDRPTGAFVSGDHFLEVTGNGPRQQAERRRRRHEKEEAIARKVGGFWRGRGCIPANGCYGRSGREGRKRRRVWLYIIGGLLAMITLIVVLAVTLTHRGGEPTYSPWLNLTDFPPIPTGLQTVIAPDNSDAVSGCVNPATLWSCSLPKEQAPANRPFAANQPQFAFQIQYDNNARRLWDVPDGQIPRPTPNVNGQNTLQNQTQTVDGSGNGTNGTTSGSVQGQVGRRGLAAFVRQLLFGRDAAAYDPGFLPSPAPPAFEEMWFLGNTTDGIVSDRKAGEPTPFYITILQTLASPPVGPNMVTRRASFLRLNETVPPPETNPDGTSAPAVLLPRPIQQPLRLYDRGQPTEHYGFYTYFSRTIYAKGIAEGSPLGDSSGVFQSDQDGGALESEASFLVTWGMTRFKVEFWTRLENSTRLVSGPQGVAASNSTRPGTFPYPIAFTLDTHGGDPKLKGTWSFNVTQDQHIDRSGFQFKIINYGLGGDQINPAALNNTSFGGFDGGRGGCMCAYKNFVGATT